MNRLKYHLEKRGLSVGKLARILGLSDTTVRLASTGHIRPYPKLRKSIAEALGVAESEIFSPEGWVRQDEITESAE